MLEITGIRLANDLCKGCIVQTPLAHTLCSLTDIYSHLLMKRGVILRWP